MQKGASPDPSTKNSHIFTRFRRTGDFRGDPYRGRVFMYKARLIMIDDEEAFCEAMEKRLAHRGLEVLTAYSGADGLKKLDEHHEVDVILLDVKMPEMDGIETLRRIKAAHPITEVIMLTGHATVESAIEGMKLGASDYLMKPCDIDILVTKVEEAAKAKRDHQTKIMEAMGKELRGERAR